MTLSGSRPIVFVHGFLGLAGDWQPFARPERDRLIDLWPVAARLSANAADPFAAAAAEILKAPPGEKPILIAYSLGARLAMHALLEGPEAFHSAILISGNPGLTSDFERAARLEADRAWAGRFRREPWRELLAAWNGQAVLEPAQSADALALSREEMAFDREALACALENWSLGRQRDLRGELRRLRLPLLFLTGANDTKFSALNRALDFGEHREVADCGHRVPWEQPHRFTEMVTLFQSRWP